jgi:RNA polymerase primary sigma factor
MWIPREDLTLSTDRGEPPRAGQGSTPVPFPSAVSRRAEGGPWWRGSARGSARRGRKCEFRDPQETAAELALVDRAKRGGPREREELVEAFLPMIVSVSHAYRRATRIDQHELTQEGIVGLLRALERFDADRGVPFWAYAAWWVRQAMQQLVSELARPMVLSDRALRRLARIKDAHRRFEQTHHRSPSSAEVAQIVGLRRSQVESLLCTERSARGLDEPLSGEPGDGTTMRELLADPRAWEAYERVPERLLAATLPGLLEHLTERERTVICSRYGIGMRERMLREIAPILGLTAERVRQIEQESLTKLRAVV